MNIGKRLFEEMKNKGWSEGELSRRSGVPQPTIHRIVAKEVKNPKSSSIEKIAKALEIDFSWLLTGKGSKDSPVKEMVTTAKDDNVIEIPLYDVQASMGTGITPPSFLKLIRNITVEKEFFVINNIKITSFENLVMVTGIGDSMLPTFNSGDPIIVDMGISIFKEDGIYFFTLENDLYVKRLQKLPKCLRMISDNPVYDAFDIRGEDLNNLIFHGKALYAWNGRRI